jgi:hypothetical protein
LTEEWRLASIKKMVVNGFGILQKLAKKIKFDYTIKVVIKINFPSIWQ